MGSISGRRLLLLSLLVYGLFVLGLASLQGALIALAIPLIIYLGEALLYSPGELKLRVTRELSADCVQQDEDVTVTLSITNEGSDLEEVLIQDRLPPGIYLVEADDADDTSHPWDPQKPLPTHKLTSLRSGETVTLEYTVSGWRGSFEFKGVEVIASDRLGLFHRKATLAAHGYILILPDVVRMRRIAIRPLRTLGSAGPIPARQSGAGVDFFGVREYQQGDPMRWINWRASARHPRAIFTNEFEQERIADVGLILDARQRSEIRLNGVSLFEHAVRATAALADIFIQDGNRVGLLVYGRGLEWTLPGYGKVQRERILRALARAKTGDSLVFESMDYLPTRLFPPKSQIVLLSPLCQDDLPMLTRLRSRGYQVLIITPDPVTFEANYILGYRAQGRSQETRLAMRLARIERVLLLRRLQHVGIRVVDWPVDQPLDQTIHTALGRMPAVAPAGLRGQWIRNTGTVS